MAISAAASTTERRGLIVVWIASAIQAAIFYALGYAKYTAHRTLVDFGLFTQTIASATSTFSNTFENASHWAFHFSPILYICAPFVTWAHSGLALTAIQSIAVALTVPPAYLIARRLTSVRRALAIAGVVLLYPPLAGVAFTDFHENGFAPAATMWLLWALDRRRWAFAYFFLALTLAIKEDQAPIVGFLGLVALVIFYRRNDRAGVRFALTAMTASLLVFVAFFTLIRPLTDDAHQWQPSRFYAWTQLDLQTTGLQSIPGRIGYLLLALAPLAFIPLRSRLMFLAIPGFAECLLSREPAPYTMGQHYAAVWIPYVLVAFVAAAARLRSPRWIGASALLCALTYLVANPLHPGYFLRTPGARDARLDAFLARLPADVQVGTQEEAYTHLGLDARAQLGIAGDPEYVLLDRDYPDSIWLAWTEPLLRREVTSGRYALAERDGGIELYRRTDSIAPKI